MFRRNRLYTQQRTVFSSSHSVIVICICMTLLMSVYPSPGQAKSPDVVLRGTVTHADLKTYRDVPFDVPAGVARVTVEFSYTQKENRTTIDLGLFDSERFRGWSGGNKNSFTVSETDATPSYLPGRIVPGRWKLLLGIPAIRDGVRSEYLAKIYFTRDTDTPEVSTFSIKPLHAGAGWYRGDLHMHDSHSDGSCRSQAGEKVPCPLYRTVEAAAGRGLDFIAITDHNTTSHYDAMRELQPYFDKLLLIPGREITTFEGHANVYGTTAFVDFRLTSANVPNVNDLLAQVQHLHGLFSINHPGAPSGEMCMGCGWTAPNTDFARVTAIEAVNGSTSEGPYAGIPFWQAHLNQGFRLTGVGGSDNHDSDIRTAQPGPRTPSPIGHPTTVVFARELSERAILDGIKAGHVFIDVQGSTDRRIELTAEADGVQAAMGDVLHAAAGDKVHLMLSMTALDGGHPEVIEDGQSVALMDVSPIQRKEEARSFDVQSDGKRHWIRINIRSSDGSLLIVGNPIYLN